MSGRISSALRIKYCDHQTVRDGGEVVPRPTVVAARLALGLLDVNRVPWWAAEWLAQGHDGESLRTLAGLNDRDPLAIHDVLLDALAETGTTVPASDRDAASVVFRDVVRQFVSKHLNERQVARAVDQVLATVMYSNEVVMEPLGQLNGVDDEWSGGWGRNDAELRAIVREACIAQLVDEPSA